MTAHTVPVDREVLPRRNILGVSVVGLGWEDGLSLLRGLIAQKRFTRVAFLNAHSGNVAARQPDFAAALENFLVLPDGIGVDLAAKLLYGARFPANMNGTDFVPALLKAETAPLHVGLIGARRENVETAARKLSVLAPQHRFTVIHDGFFTLQEQAEILQTLADARPDILLVAMGVPRQEIWIFKNITERHCTMPIAVGALFDFLSGAVPRAPEWMRRLRLEWVFRLMLEPKRMWRRYIVGNPLFLARVLAQRLRRKRGSSA